MSQITEIQFVPVKPQNGLVAFVSFVLDRSLYLSSIGIVTRPEGGYRLLYPTKKTFNKDFAVFHPISKEFGVYLEKVILKEYEKVMKYNDRYFSTNNPSN
jgi:DNA-binding cell septation regulator SpoVG